MACLPQGRTLFRYGKDHYAFQLLQLAAAGGTTVASLRRSIVAPLLEKPRVREWLSRRGSGVIHDSDFEELQWASRAEWYRLSLSIWGEDIAEWKYNQVSRRGASLVLHLAHTSGHWQKLQGIHRRHGSDPFNSWGHPETGGVHPTLAWARLDIDFDRGEALIEEIQSDRIRDVERVVKSALQHAPRTLVYCCGSKVQREVILSYWEREMKRHAAIWDEAMLAAALDFLFREIGIRKVFYHTFDSGCALKRIRWGKPPRSIYTTLPRRFCFQPTDEVPEMLAESRSWRRRAEKQREEVRFQLLKVQRA